ncbi:DNA polymerase delta small subunit isoform X2 [Rhododendron vialii]|uniref:DNA polymerase delta small subunit isoform X2 n=1 Tax=Rhododendron vialii TaxID=182163 RepID=UPI00265F22AD|nr:DNA polymerase delta small subunit isoform X2 [Rhododendron vialii]
MEAMEVDTLQRKQSVYQFLDEGFKIQKEMYRGQQYSQIYFARLHLMRTLLYSLLPNWKPHLPVCTVLGLEEGKECIIVGTLYKHMKLKPNILDEYSKERSAAPLVKPHNFIHPDDHLILEDESGRVKLRGNVLLPSVYVTGIVVALHGKESGAGDFWVEEILEAGLPEQIELPLKSEDKYVAFVSGLSVGSSTSNPLQFQLLVDHITGYLGDEKEQSIAAQIVQVVIAGNSVEIPGGLLNGQNLASKDQSKMSEPVKELDILLTQIAAGVPLDIMPGPNDPSNFALPQQPLHRCLFPGSSAYNTFKSCTNPHSFELDNIRFLGTSGQNIDDLEKYSEAKDKLDFMERTLRWRHIAPTAPNTLGCYPFTDRDPFFVESCPHVYFVGNQDRYDSRIIKGSEGQVVRLVCIPRFGETGIAVVLNMKNLECHALSFATQFSS